MKNIGITSVRLSITHLILVFLVVQLAFSQLESPVYIQNTIPLPTHIQITNQTFEFQAQVTVPFRIQPSSLLYPVYRSNMQNNLNGQCRLQYLQVDKHFGDYIKFQKNQLGKFQGWNIQIIDAAYSSLQQKIYALLNNGSFIVGQMRQNIEQIKQIKHFQMFDYNTKSNSMIWELDKYDVYASGNMVYLLRDKQLYRVNFTLGSKQWSMLKVHNGDKINQVITQKDQLYLVKNTKILKINNDSTTQIPINFTSKGQKDPLPYLISLSIDNGYMYILCRNQGIILVNINKNYQVVGKYMLDFHNNAYSIKAKSFTVLVNFRLYRKTFIGELFFIFQHSSSQAPKIKLNKFYYRFGKMDKIIMFEDFAAVYSLSQINFFQHSINRHSPFGEMQTQLLHRAWYPKILDMIPLHDKNLTFILVQKHGIFVQSIGNQQQRGLMDSQVQCTFKEPGSYNLSIIYEGFCRENKNPTQTYCSKKNTYKFQVSDQKIYRQTQAYNDHLFLVLVLIIVFVLVFGAVIAYGKNTQRRGKQIMALLQRRTGGNSQVMSNMHELNFKKQQKIQEQQTNNKQSDE